LKFTPGWLMVLVWPLSGWLSGGDDGDQLSLVAEVGHLAPESELVGAGVTGVIMP
jgi:hypothetical protein